MRKECALLVLVTIAGLVTGCGGDVEESPASPESSASPESPLSTPVTVTETERESPLATPAFGSPLATQSPIPTPSSVAIFAPQLDRPINVGDTEVCGTGPSGLPIELYDVGLTGNQLGGAVIGDDDAFCIELDSELRAGQRVGLALGDLEGSGFTRDELREKAIINLPVIGLLFDDVTVE
jgi:hypothetical protein